VLSVLHRLGWAHRDIKPDNILLFDVAGLIEPKLGDFGLACHIDDGEDTQLLAGSNEFLPPELFIPDLRIRKQSENGAMVKWIDPLCVDVYSMGVLLYVMFVMKPVPVIGDTRERRVFASEIMTEKRIPSESARDLIVRMLERKAADRMTMEEVMEHSWVTTEPNVDLKTERKCLPELRRQVKRHRSNPEMTRLDRDENVSRPQMTRV